MKLSAKTTSTATFFAAMALGMAAFAGCTVTSTTSSDTDGGTSSSSSSSSSGGSSSSSSGSTTTDSGTDAPAAQCTENTKQTTKFDPASCQACLDAKCCDKLVACFGQDPNAGQDGGANVDCNAYSDCIADCNGKGGDVEACYGICDAATSQGIVTAYEILEKCGADNCAAECQ